jgi:hypothetical protein
MNRSGWIFVAFALIFLWLAVHLVHCEEFSDTSATVLDSLKIEEINRFELRIGLIEIEERKAKIDSLKKELAK